MKDFDSARWGRLRADLAKGLKQGLLSSKKSARVDKKYTDLSTEKGKRRYKLISLKLKVYQGISDLGARVYSLMWSGKKDPSKDPRLKDITARIRRYETQIEFMETNLKSAARNKLGKSI
jgi:hypothetical protein